MPKKPNALTELALINQSIADLDKKLEKTISTQPDIALFVYLDLIKAQIERVSLENMHTFNILDKKIQKNIEILQEKPKKVSFWSKIKGIFNK